MGFGLTNKAFSEYLTTTIGHKKQKKFSWGSNLENIKISIQISLNPLNFIKHKKGIQFFVIFSEFTNYVLILLACNSKFENLTV